MGFAIDDQIRTLAAAVLLGMALALLYDLLRALRLRRARLRWFSSALDIIFCLVLALAGLAFALGIGNGELRLYTLLAAAGGAALFFGVFSPLLRPLWDFWARTLFELLRLLRLPLRKAKKLYGNLHKIVKRVFLFSRRSYIISSYGRHAQRARRRAEFGGGVRYGGKGGKTEKARKPAGNGARSGAAARGEHPADEHARPTRPRAGGEKLAH